MAVVQIIGCWISNLGQICFNKRIFVCTRQQRSCYLIVIHRHNVHYKHSQKNYIQQKSNRICFTFSCFFLPDKRRSNISRIFCSMRCCIVNVSLYIVAFILWPCQSNIPQNLMIIFDIIIIKSLCLLFHTAFTVYSGLKMRQ